MHEVRVGHKTSETEHLSLLTAHKCQKIVSMRKILQQNVALGQLSHLCLRMQTSLNSYEQTCFFFLCCTCYFNTYIYSHYSNIQLKCIHSKIVNQNFYHVLLNMYGLIFFQINDGKPTKISHYAYSILLRQLIVMYTHTLPMHAQLHYQLS